MSLAVVHTRALIGLHAPEVLVEVHLANGLPSFTLVGLADTEVKERACKKKCVVNTVPIRINDLAVALDAFEARFCVNISCSRNFSWCF